MHALNLQIVNPNPRPAFVSQVKEDVKAEGNGDIAQKSFKDLLESASKDTDTASAPERPSAAPAPDAASAPGEAPAPRGASGTASAEEDSRPGSLAATLPGNRSRSLRAIPPMPRRTALIFRPSLRTGVFRRRKRKRLLRARAEKHRGREAKQFLRLPIIVLLRKKSLILRVKSGQKKTPAATL